MTDKEKFIQYKMKILVGEENYNKSQAYAIANSLYEQKNKAQQGVFAGQQYDVPANIGYNYNNPYAPPTAYNYNQQDYQLPSVNINNNGFQYDPSLVGGGLPSDVLKTQVNPLSADAVSGMQDQTQYNDITRVNLPNLYAGVDLSASLAYAGQGYGSGNAYQAALGTGLSALKGARNFLTGYSSGKESDRVKREQYDNLYNQKINYAYAQEGGTYAQNMKRVGQSNLNQLGEYVDPYAQNMNTVGNTNMQTFSNFLRSPVNGVTNFLQSTGVTYGTPEEQLQGTYNTMYQEGEKITNSELLTDQYAVDEGSGNYNLESNEYLKRAKTGDVQQVVGEPHTKNGKVADGVNVNLENGDKVLSDYTKIPAKNVKELKERYDLSLKKGATFADAQKAYDRKLGIQKETDSLADSIEKYGKNSQVKDETTKRLNDVILSKEVEAGKKKLDLLGAPQSMIFDELFTMQEALPKKSGGSVLLDDKGKPIQEESNVKQQGGEIADLAKKFGISVERANELLTMQEGGQPVSEEQVAQEQPSQEQVMQFIAQSLQGGADPQEILAQLVQKGIPAEVAQQLVEQTIGQLQQAPQEEQGETIQEPVEEAQGMAQQGVGFSFATRYAPPIQGYDVTGSSVVDKDVLTGVEEMQAYTGTGYGKQMANVEDLIKLHSDWYFTTPEKKEAFRTAAKKEGSQPEVKAFQAAYNAELLKRGERAGVPKTELNDIIKQVGFTEEGARKLDGLVGAFTSTRPLYDFSKSKEGEVKIDVTPVETVNAEQRNITKQALPLLPQDLRLAPSALNPLVKEQIALQRAEPLKQTTEPFLAEQERMRQTDIERVQASGLPPQAQEALLSQGLASSQMAANDAIAKTEVANQSNQARVDEFNIGQRAKEDVTNAQYNQVYQGQMLQGMNNYERDLRAYYNEANLDNEQNYRDIESVNLLNAPNSQYAYIPGQGIEFLNNKATVPVPTSPTDNWYDMATPAEIEILKKRKAAQARAEGTKNYTTTIKTP